MNRRVQGTSLLELMVVIPLITGTGLMLGQIASVAFQWKETVELTVAASTEEQRIATAVAEALREATPVAGLTVGPAGLLEKEGAGTRFSAETGAFVLRADGAYWIFQKSGARLVRRRIGFDGQVSDTVVATRVTTVFWTLHGEAGVPVGIEYEIGIAGRARKVHGFAARRTELAPPLPPEAPTVAPRFGEKGGR